MVSCYLHFEIRPGLLPDTITYGQFQKNLVDVHLYRSLDKAMFAFNL